MQSIYRHHIPDPPEGATVAPELLEQEGSDTTSDSNDNFEGYDANANGLDMEKPVKTKEGKEVRKQAARPWREGTANPKRCICRTCPHHAGPQVGGHAQAQALAQATV